MTQKQKDEDISIYLELITRYSDLERDIKKYITDTENWLYYWIDNPEVKNYLREFPDDWEDGVFLSIYSLSGNCMQCTISFKEHPDDVDSITRWCYLNNFRNNTIVKYKQWHSGVRERQLEELNEELEYYAKKAKEVETKINKLKNGEKDL